MKSSIAIFAAWGIAVLIQLSIVAAVIIAAMHFIRKFW